MSGTRKRAIKKESRRAKKARLRRISRDMPDLVEKEFLGFPDVFADTLNALPYEGRQVVDPRNLFPGPTESIYQGREKIRNLYQDKTMYEIEDGKLKMIHQFANQSRVEPKAILRKAGYTGAVYVEQYEDKLQEICPVDENILYWGKERWNSKYNSMKEVFGEQELPPERWEYVDNLKLNVWEMRHLSKEVRERFRSDMRIVVDYLAGENLEQCEHKVEHKEVLIKMIRVLSGEKNVDNTKDYLNMVNVKEEDDIMACEFLEQYLRRGRQEGLQEGLQKGLQKGLQEGLQEGLQNSIAICKDVGTSFEATVAQIVEKYKLSDADAQEQMKLYW